jgi:radical SAM superfamily enzyme YgiQ (UPF0313 family)
MPYADAANYLNSIAKPDLILMTSSMTYWYPGITESLQMLRKAYRNVPVWLGGNYVDLCPDHARTLGADKVVYCKEINEIASMIFKFLRIRPSAGWSDLSRSIPFYPYPSDSYFVTRLSLGCIHSCTYCASNILDGKYRLKNMEILFKDLQWALKKGFKNIVFYDDALLGDNGIQLENLLLKIEEWFYNRGRDKFPDDLRFHIPNGIHARKITPQISALMKRFNFEKIRLGYEFENPEKQAETGGKITTPELADAVNNLKNAGFEGKDIIIYILCGAPDTSYRDLEKAVDYIHSLGCRPSLALYSPVPGTDDFIKYFKNTDFEKEPLLCNKTAFTVISNFLKEEEYLKLKENIQETEKTMFNPYQ